MVVESLLKQIKDGRSGKNIGISMGLPAIDKVLYGIQRRYIYTIGADTSGGKTSFGLDIFVYNLIKNAGSRKVNILYYSFEMASEVLYAKLLSRYIYDEYHVVITFEEILSLTKPISDDKLKIVNKCVPFLNKLENTLTIYDRPLSPNYIYGTLKDWLKRFGTFIPINEHKEDYVENDIEEYKVAIIDHMGLISGPGTKKERIDTVVDYFIYFRNKCGLTGVFIQQLNRGQKSMDRKLNGLKS